MHAQELTSIGTQGKKITVLSGLEVLTKLEVGVELQTRRRLLALASLCSCLRAHDATVAVPSLQFSIQHKRS